MSSIKGHVRTHIYLKIKKNDKTVQILSVEKVIKGKFTQKHTKLLIEALKEHPQKYLNDRTDMQMSAVGMMDLGSEHFDGRLAVDFKFNF